jgi:SAM-dependent methyltransferase
VAVATASLLDRPTPLGHRLRAWWRGESFARPRRAAPSSRRRADAFVEATAPGAPLEFDDGPYWTAERIDVTQRIWGRGCARAPGGAYLIESAKPLALTPEMSVAELGSELGGFSRLLSERFGVFMRGWELSPPLVDAANEASRMAGMQRRAAFQHLDPEGLALEAESLDRIILRDCLHRIEDKGAFIDGLLAALKPRGHLMALEYLRGDDEPGDASLADWSAGRETPAAPWSCNEMEGVLVASGMVVHVFKDESRDLCRAVVQAWDRFRMLIEADGGIDPRLARSVILEGEKWLATVLALDSGRLRFCRIHATMP